MPTKIAKDSDIVSTSSARTNNFNSGDKNVAARKTILLQSYTRFAKVGGSGTRRSVLDSGSRIVRSFQAERPSKERATVTRRRHSSSISLVRLAPQRVA